MSDKPRFYCQLSPELHSHIGDVYAIYENNVFTADGKPYCVFSWLSKYQAEQVTNCLNKLIGYNAPLEASEEANHD